MVGRNRKTVGSLTGLWVINLLATDFFVSNFSTPVFKM